MLNSGYRDVSLGTSLFHFISISLARSLSLFSLPLCSSEEMTFHLARSASALAQIIEPPLDALQQYDLPRDGFLDAAFACGMATGMTDYEEAASVRKAKLFRALLSSLPQKDAVVAEIGMGSFPNAPYFAQSSARRGLSMDIIGIDPNDKMGETLQLFKFPQSFSFNVWPNTDKGCCCEATNLLIAVCVHISAVCGQISTSMRTH